MSTMSFTSTGLGACAKTTVEKTPKTQMKVRTFAINPPNCKCALLETCDTALIASMTTSSDRAVADCLQLKNQLQAKLNNAWVSSAGDHAETSLVNEPI